MDITVQNLKGAGYIQFNSSRNATALYAKFIFDADNNKLYKIGIEMYDWSEFPQIERKQTITFQPEVQFKLPNGSNFDVSYLLVSESLEEVEQFFADIYKKMKCVPYRKVGE